MIELKHVSKTFDSDSGGVDALKDVSLTIEDGDIYGIIGMSGAGKSTLVRCINLLEKPTAGEVVVDGQRLDTMTPAQLRAARREITMIFQRFNLLMQRTCLQNVCFPMELSGVKKADAVRRAKELLELVGLPDKAQAYPAQLSGGQQQRVAIARALATQPKVLLCDEATSALDPNTTHADPGADPGYQSEAGHHRGGHHPPDERGRRPSVIMWLFWMAARWRRRDWCHEVFAAPKSAAGRRLVFPGGADALVSDPQAVRRVRLTFTGQRHHRHAAGGETGLRGGHPLHGDLRLHPEAVGGGLWQYAAGHAPAATFQRAMDYIGTMSNIRVEEVDGACTVICFPASSVQDLMAVLPSLPYAIWETFYVTVLSTPVVAGAWGCRWAFCWWRGRRTACCRCPAGCCRC